MLLRRPLAAAVVLVAAMLLVSCGSSSGGSAGAPEGQGIPDVSATDVATGQAVRLASVTRSDLPTLVWFWAPH